MNTLSNSTYTNRAEVANTNDYIDELPREMKVEIGSYLLDSNSLVKTALVSKEWLSLNIQAYWKNQWGNRIIKALRAFYHLGINQGHETEGLEQKVKAAEVVLHNLPTFKRKAAYTHNFFKDWLTSTLYKAL